MATAPVRVPKPLVACPVCKAWVEQLHSDRAPWCAACAEERKKCPDLDPLWTICQTTEEMRALDWRYLDPAGWCDGCKGHIFRGQSLHFPFVEWRIHAFPEGPVVIASVEGPGRKLPLRTAPCSWCGNPTIDIDPCPRCRYQGVDA